MTKNKFAQFFLRHGVETTEDGTIINSTAATVAFSCTMKALSPTQSHKRALRIYASVSDSLSELIITSACLHPVSKNITEDTH